MTDKTTFERGDQVKFKRNFFDSHAHRYRKGIWHDVPEHWIGIKIPKGAEAKNVAPEPQPVVLNPEGEENTTEEAEKPSMPIFPKGKEKTVPKEA